MILVDTSVWIDHLRAADEQLVRLLQQGQVLAHPFVIGEIALGSLRNRAEVIADLQYLPRAIAASDAETLEFIERRALGGSGIGYIDAHLLAGARLTPECKLWTRDKRLQKVAAKLDLAAAI
jgi:predicted nucleic acid-binding protein